MRKSLHLAAAGLLAAAALISVVAFADAPVQTADANPCAAAFCLLAFF